MGSGIGVSEVAAYFAGKSGSSKKKPYDRYVDSTEKFNKEVMEANERADWLEAGMTLALIGQQNEYELKVLLIVFAMFALYIIF
jgi:hypothetical protein